MSTKQKKDREVEEFDISKYLVETSTQIHTINIPETGDEFDVSIKPIAWSKRNKIVSECLNWKDGGAVDFDGDRYVRDCLKLMIVQAPWGATDEAFLTSIDARLGGALENLVPKAFGDEASDVSTIKKE